MRKAAVCSVPLEPACGSTAGGEGQAGAARAGLGCAAFRGHSDRARDVDALQERCHCRVQISSRNLTRQGEKLVSQSNGTRERGVLVVFLDPFFFFF